MSSVIRSAFLSFNSLPILSNSSLYTMFLPRLSVIRLPESVIRLPESVLRSPDLVNSTASGGVSKFLIKICTTKSICLSISFLASLLKREFHFLGLGLLDDNPLFKRYCQTDLSHILSHSKSFCGFDKYTKITLEIFIKKIKSPL